MTHTEALKDEILRLREQVTELQRASSDEVERRRAMSERAAFLADLQPWEWVAVRDIVEQYKRAIAKWPPYASAHEGYGLMAEEVAELLDEIRKPTSSERFIRSEAKDVAVVALRMMLECST